MFLKDLKEDSQKILFLEFNMLIMMAEGDEDTTCKDIKETSINYKSNVFWQNINEQEGSLLLKQVEEIAEKDKTSIFYSNYGSKDILNQLTISFGSHCLINSIENQMELTLSEYSKLEEFKTEVMREIFLSREDILNIDAEMIKRFMLKNSRVKQEILIRTADSVLEYRKDNLDNFDSKEKKIILFELIRSAYNSGGFNDYEKTIFLHICKILEIENEYIEEFIDVSTRLFKIKEELVDLIEE